MIILNPGFHMIATIAVVIAATAEKKKNNNFRDRSDHSDHMRQFSCDRSDNNRCEIWKFYLSDRCACDRWIVVSIWSLNFFLSAIAAIIAIISQKPGLIYHNNHPPFLLNCYLHALQSVMQVVKINLIVLNLPHLSTFHIEGALFLRPSDHTQEILFQLS